MTHVSPPSGADPLVTIGIPAYNSAPFIRQAVLSALNQTYANIEVLVVDDASSDGTLGALADLAESEPRLRVLSNEHNLGFVGNHNRLLAEARGEYVKLLHSDDLIAEDAVALQLAALRANPGTVLVTCRRSIVDDSGATVLHRGPSWPEGVVPGAEAIRRVVRQGANLIGEPSAGLFLRQAALDAGGFAEGFHYVVDLDFWVRLLERGDLYYLPKALASFRLRSGQTSSRVSAIQASEMHELMQRLRSRPELGVTEQDVRRGARSASRQAVLRRAFLLFFSIPHARREKLLYLVVGGWNTLFGYLVFSLLYYLIGARVGEIVTLLLTYPISTVNAYLGYKFLVFRTRGNYVREFIKFSSVYVGALVANVVLLPILTRVVGLSAYVAQAIFTVAIVVASYVGHKYFTFRTPAERVAESEASERQHAEQTD